MRGYQQEEVDKFLDMIIKRLRSFSQGIWAIKATKCSFKAWTRRTKLAATQVPQQPVVQTPVAQPVYNNTNTDILKRLSNLEKAVFGSKLYE